MSALPCWTNVNQAKYEQAAHRLLALLPKPKRQDKRKCAKCGEFKPCLAQEFSFYTKKFLCSDCRPEPQKTQERGWRVI